MQVRRHGQQIQLLRASYLSQEKRSRQRLLGSFPASCRSLEEVPNSLTDQLTIYEREQLQAWFDRQRSSRAGTPFPLPKVGATLQGVIAIVQMASEVVFRTDDNISSSDVTRLSQAVSQLLDALVLRGYAMQVIRLLAPVENPGEVELTLRSLTRLSRVDVHTITPEDEGAYWDAVNETQEKLLKILGKKRDENVQNHIGF